MNPFLYLDIYIKDHSKIKRFSHDTQKLFYMLMANGDNDWTKFLRIFYPSIQCPQNTSPVIIKLRLFRHTGVIFLDD